MATLADPATFQRAKEIIDAAHNEDPTGQELIYADNVEKYLRILVAPRELNGVEVIAGRCQHLRRFLHPRSTYPEGKAGYLRWRRELYTIQADYSSTLLSPLSLPEAELAEIYNAIAKKDLMVKAKVHPTTTLLEDAAVLVFLSEEVDVFKKQHEDYDEEKWVGIVWKTWRKLSQKGREEAAKLLPEMEDGLRKIVERAVAEESSREAGE
ncbi:hypothetical protein H072_9588 [Dactylellina haptotyla CBS 200.50]|uniref:Glutamyl-tRNA synthetase n=1 Tax=Dactylellina haptotyla (strain CBS 200.50) TaxID=1284197 RepID=S8A2B2_DACHA|nr:hypothetical protein H072_9588 [Dactylellina haptotyla CBS 200.50]